MPDFNIPSKDSNIISFCNPHSSKFSLTLDREARTVTIFQSDGRPAVRLGYVEMRSLLLLCMSAYKEASPQNFAEMIKSWEEQWPEMTSYLDPRGLIPTE